MNFQWLPTKLPKPRAFFLSSTTWPAHIRLAAKRAPYAESWWQWRFCGGVANGTRLSQAENLVPVVCSGCAPSSPSASIDHSSYNDGHYTANAVSWHARPRRVVSIGECWVFGSLPGSSTAQRPRGEETPMAGFHSPLEVVQLGKYIFGHFWWKKTPFITIGSGPILSVYIVYQFKKKGGLSL